MQIDASVASLRATVAEKRVDLAEARSTYARILATGVTPNRFQGELVAAAVEDLNRAASELEGYMEGNKESAC